jgi:hypothetical protein
VSLERGAGVGKKRVGSRDCRKKSQNRKISPKIKKFTDFFKILILVKIWIYYHGFKKALNRQNWKKFGNFSSSKISWINCSMSLGI